MYRYSLRLVREAAPDPIGRQVLTPADAAAFLKPMLYDEAVEVAVVLMLDRRHRLRGYHEVGRGGVAHAAMESREVLSSALHAGAAAFMVAHNHPSGEATASADDIAVTRRLMRGAELVGLEFVDHIIVAGDEWSSLVESRVV